MLRSIILFTLLLSTWACSEDAAKEAKVSGKQKTSEKEFHKYWYKQGAEISKFDLQQGRYGELHEGHSVLVFVTEKMNPKLQVKADNPTKKDLPVLKLNATRKFNTGIYPYSIMTSTFTSLTHEHPAQPIKVTTTVQEWCGHVFTQLNLREGEYKAETRSYFESESDQNFKLKGLPTEEGLWTQIRIDPSQLPTGEFEMLPGTVYIRLSHKPFKPRKVTAMIQNTEGKSLEGNALSAYTLNFQEDKRTLKIVYEKQFPHRIQSWEDTYPSFSGKVLTTKAVRTHTIYSYYWNKHDNEHRKLLESLGLQPL